MQAVYDRDRLLMAAHDGERNRVFQLNYNLHTDEDWKGNSGNGNGNKKENSKSEGTDDAGYGNATNAEEHNSQNQSGILFPVAEEISRTETDLIAMIKTTGKEKDYELIEYILNVNTQYTQVLMELNENGAMDAAYTYGVSRLTEDRFTGESNFYLYDPAGNVAGITDQDGYLWQSYRYDAFGNATFGSPQYDNEYTFNAESYNPNIRSQYLRARYYDMVKGNFLTEDSYLGDIRNPLTLNRYSYCIGNPLFYDDPSGHDVKSFVKTALFGNEKVIEAKNRLIAKGDKWAEKVIQDYLIKQNKFMDDTYDWYGRNPLMSNDTTYGQINNNFTAGVVGSAYKITNPKYIAANAYSAAAHPLQTLDRININGQDALNGVMGIADKIRNKEYGALARGAGYAAGNLAQVALARAAVKKCGDLLDKKRGETLLPPPPVDKGGSGTGKIRTQAELDALATDPAHGGKIGAKSIAERDVGLGLESQGKVNSLVRDPSGSAEFIDTITGQK